MVANVEVLRKKINYLDKTLVKILGLRMNVVKRIGEYKKLHKIPHCDK